jgi:hypothetical protein
MLYPIELRAPGDILRQIAPIPHWLRNLARAYLYASLSPFVGDALYGGLRGSTLSS